MTSGQFEDIPTSGVSTHMPLARHDSALENRAYVRKVSTHMPLARHDVSNGFMNEPESVSTHMPLARHDEW